MWEVVWGRILTEDRLKIKGWLLAGYCCMSNDVEELVSLSIVGKLEGYDTSYSLCLAFHGFSHIW